MDNLDLAILSLLFFLVYLFVNKIKSNYCKKHDETFSETLNNPTNNPTKNTKTVARQIDLLEDKSFDDIVFYRSEQVWGEETGLQKCLKNCNGTCVEFGVTNDSMCFPKI